MKKVVPAFVTAFAIVSLFPSLVAAEEKPANIKKTGPVAKTPGGLPWENAFEFQTDHYTIHIDIPEAEAMKVAKTMEHLLTAMCEVFNLDIKQWGNRKNCYFFNDINKFRQVRDAIKGPQTAVHGYVSETNLYCYVKGRGYANLYWTYLHEGCHLNFNALLGAQRYNSNYWAVEAIACYMGSLKMKEDGSFVFGEEDHGGLKKATDQYKDKLGEMVPWGYDQFVYRKDRGTYYVLGYGVCHYLFNGEGGKHKKKFGEYIKTVQGGKAKPGSFQEIVGMSPADLQKSAVPYIQNLR